MEAEEEGKYRSRASKLSATFKLLWTTAGILPASDGFNSSLHRSLQPLSPLFSSFLSSKMDSVCVLCSNRFRFDVFHTW